MSSILDALNKLEQEKTQAARESEQSELDPALTAHDLVGRSMLRDRVTLRVTPVALLLSVGALIITLVIVALAVILMMMRADKKPATQIAANTPAATSPSPASVAAPTPAVNLPPSDPPPAAPAVVPQAQSNSEPAPTAQQAPATQTVTPPPAQATQIQPEATVAAPAPVPAPTVVARQPDKPIETPVVTTPEVKEEAVPTATAPKEEPPVKAPAVSEASAAPEEKPAPRTRVAAAPVDNDDPELPSASPRRPPAPKSTAATKPGKDVALDRLPIFTESDGIRYGFERIRINMMKPADATNPQGAAILSIAETSSDGSVVRNTMRFYEGQRIQQSPLRIFKVEEKRIGIEDVRTGDRYQLKF